MKQGEKAGLFPPMRDILEKKKITFFEKVIVFAVGRKRRSVLLVHFHDAGRSLSPCTVLLENTHNQHLLPDAQKEAKS